MLAKSLTAAVFVGLVDTVEDTITTLARWNALSIVTPILASRTVYITLYISLTAKNYTNNKNFINCSLTI